MWVCRRRFLEGPNRGAWARLPRRRLSRPVGLLSDGGGSGERLRYGEDLCRPWLVFGRVRGYWR